MTNSGFVTFGDRRTFAIEARRLPDPDASTTSDSRAWSFGEFRIYLRERCLTRHTAPGGVRDEIRWYLAPIFDWLSRVWLPLFHEQHFPPAVGTHEHPIIRFEQGERLLLDDLSADASSRRSEMQGWRMRHSFWSAASGGVLPNLWFRRQSDLCEISYDPGVTVGAPRAFEFQFSRGAVLLDVDIVAKALLEFLTWGIANGSEAKLPQDSRSRAEEAERWLVGDHLARLLLQKDRPASQLNNGVAYPLSPEVAMFGTLTPSLSADDGASLLDALDRARSSEPEGSELLSLTCDMAPATRETSWGQGYELALQTVEALGSGQTEPIDIGRALHRLGVHVEDLAVGDRSLRGVAVAGEGFRPTIIVNPNAKWNRSESGRRFTLAHEFAHVLVDRGRARRVTHSSTPWAPEAVERRANAFTAMFLMPYQVVDAALAKLGRVTDGKSLDGLARRLRCSKAAVLEHLGNIDRIDRTLYFQLRADL